MCDDHGHVHVPAVEAVPREADWPGEVLPLEPVDSVSVLTVCDNTVDILLRDEGPAKRLPLGGSLTGEAVPLLEAAALEEGKSPDAPLAEHGFSVLVEIRKGDAVRRLLFDTGLTPNGCVENLRRLGRDPGDLEVIVCSHGHFDHTTGLSGLIDRVGRTNMPVVIHPEFWAHRRLAIPGVEPIELPTTSRRALEGAGFDIVENRQPSFLFERSVLITVEVDRTTTFEQGFLFHEARRNGSWEPDPLILETRRSSPTWPGRAARAHGVRTRGRDQHLSVRPAVDRHRRDLRRHRRLPPQRPALRADHRRHGRRVREPGTRCARPSPLHGLEGDSCNCASTPDAFVQNSVGTTFELTSG